MPIKSMTAFARQACDDAGLELHWEVRSVNHRFLDMHVRLPEPWRQLETEVRALLSQYVQRGKVDCQLIEQKQTTNLNPQNLNSEALHQLLSLSKRIQQQVHTEGLGITPLSTLDILQYPGVLSASNSEQDLAPKLLAHLEQALQQLQQQRQQEGDKIAEFLRQRSEELATEVKQVRDCYPEVLAYQQDKFKQHFSAVEQANNERLEQELLLWVQKMDVAEELSRLDMHLSALETALSEDKAVGRRLDFLMQELNREANTLGSKSQHQRTSQAAIDMKVLIEQMREQVQNVL